MKSIPKSKQLTALPGIQYAMQIKRFRIQRKLTQGKLAELIHVNIGSITRWETGLGRPSARSWGLLLELQGIEPVYNGQNGDVPDKQTKPLDAKLNAAVRQYQEARDCFLESIEYIIDGRQD